MSSAMVDSFDRLECRNQQIELRIKSLEKKLPFLRPHEKWPTAQWHQDHEANLPAASRKTSPPAKLQPKKQKVNDRSSNSGTSHTESNVSQLAAPLSLADPVASQATAQHVREGPSVIQRRGKDKMANAVQPKLADSPFPVSEDKKYTIFPQFAKLPAE